MDRKIKFGVCADLHVSGAPYAERFLREFLDACKKENVDFVIQLGDFCLPDKDRYPESKRYSDKDKIIGMYREFEKPAYHVMGNHDSDTTSKADVLRFWGVDHGLYYSFDRNGYHFVILDGNYMRIGDKYVSYEGGNYFAHSGLETPVLPVIDDVQLRWLEEDLAKTQYPSILFSHQRLCWGWESILNYADVQRIVDRAPNGVLMAINGHEHLDSVERIGNTWYYNVNSITNYWLGEEFAVYDVYGDGIADKEYPGIEYSILYSDPLYAIITVDDKGATIKGTKADYVGPGPEERGAYEPGTYFHKTLTHTKISASIKDRYLPFNL